LDFFNTNNLIQTLSPYITAVVGIISIVVSIAVHRFSRRIREITCYINSNKSTVEVKAGEALAGEIKIFYQDRPINNLFVTQLTIKNTGNERIRKAEVVSPIRFDFNGETSTLLRVPTITNSSSTGLKVKPRLEQEDHTGIAYAEFDLFNPNEEFQIEFIHTGQFVTPHITARIDDIHEIKIVSGIQSDPRRLWSIILGLGLIVFALGSSVYAASFVPQQILSGLLISALVVLTIAASIGFLFSKNPRS